MRNDDIRSKFCILRISGKNKTSDSNELAIFLSKKLRDSDLVTVYNNQHWCLLPTDNIEGIQNRLAEVAKSADGCALSFDDYAISSYLFPRYSLHRLKNGKELLDILDTTEMGNSPAPDNQLAVTMSDGVTVKHVPLYSS